MDEKEDFNIETDNADSEISSIAGPQLVVPVDNARYALMLLMQGGEVYMIHCMEQMQYKVKKVKILTRIEQKVISYVRKFLDEIAPIENSSWREITEIKQMKIFILTRKK